MTRTDADPWLGVVRFTAGRGRPRSAGGGGHGRGLRPVPASSRTPGPPHRPPPAPVHWPAADCLEQVMATLRHLAAETARQLHAFLNGLPTGATTGATTGSTAVAH